MLRCRRCGAPAEEDLTFLVTMLAYGSARRRLVCLAGHSSYLDGDGRPADVTPLAPSATLISARPCTICGKRLGRVNSLHQRVHFGACASAWSHHARVAQRRKAMA